MKKCDDTVNSFISGYCKCNDNWRTPDYSCGHKPITCESECRSIPTVYITHYRMYWMESNDELFSILNS